MNAGEVAARVRDAHERGAAIRVAGAGTWLGAGHPVRGAEPLALTELRGIVAYTPGDLTMTVEAGTTLAEVDEATRAHGQWCPMLPWGDDRGTIGATIATATTGPFAATLGRPRDLVLGVEAVDGTGRVIAAGGRVVKNVAGFDLTRTFTGSWGTLAVITRAHLRLRARPTVDETWALVLGPDADAMGGTHETDSNDLPGDTAKMPAALRAYVRGPHAPLACIALRAEESARLGAGDAQWLLRIGGNATATAAARKALLELGRARQLDAEVWAPLRLVRDPEPRALRWRWDTLSRRLKTTFDPRNVLNPGLLGDQS